MGKQELESRHGAAFSIKSHLSEMEGASPGAVRLLGMEEVPEEANPDPQVQLAGAGSVRLENTVEKKIDIIFLYKSSWSRRGDRHWQLIVQLTA